MRDAGPQSLEAGVMERRRFLWSRFFGLRLGPTQSFSGISHRKIAESVLAGTRAAIVL